MEYLASAIMARRVEDVLDLLGNPRTREHIRLNSPFSNGRHTPLQLAVLFNSVSIVKILLDAGADPVMCGSDRDAPMIYASQLGFVEVVQEFLLRGVSTESSSDDRCRPLFAAASSGRAEVVKLLCQAGAFIEWKQAGFFTALYMACQCGHLGVVRVLLEAGACLGPQGRRGFTPLIQASHRGFVAIVNELLKHGSDVHTRNDQGYTALHLAALAGRTEVAELLLAKGANPREPGMQGVTPIRMAMEGGFPEMKKLLEEHKIASVKPTGTKLPISLHECALAGDAGGIRYLLSRGADPNAKDEEGCTPLHHTVNRFSPPCTWPLLASGADPKIPQPTPPGTNKYEQTPLRIVLQTMKWNERIAGFSPGFTKPEEARNIEQLKLLLLRAAAYDVLWRWPVVGLSEQLQLQKTRERSLLPSPLVEEGRQDRKQHGVASGTNAGAREYGVALNLTLAERSRRSRLRKRVLWKGLLR